MLDYSLKVFLCHMLRICYIFCNSESQQERGKKNGDQMKFCIDQKLCERLFRYVSTHISAVTTTESLLLTLSVPPTSWSTASPCAKGNNNDQNRIRQNKTLMAVELLFIEKHTCSLGLEEFGRLYFETFDGHLKVPC